MRGEPMTKCDKKGEHLFSPRYDEETVKQSDDYKTAQVKQTYICEICTRCGLIIKREK